MHKHKIKNTDNIFVQLFGDGLVGLVQHLYAVAPQSLTGDEMSSSGRPVIRKGHV